MHYKRIMQICNAIMKEVFDMTILEVIDSAPINGDTTVIIKGDDSVLKNGIGILDANGKPYKIKSVGMTSTVGGNETTPLLVEGDFRSSRIFV